MRPYFIFKDINCIDYGIYISEMPPEQFGEDEFEYIEVPGRDGYLSINKDRKKPINKTIKGTFFDKNNRAEVMDWLKGEGKLILSTETDYYYQTRIISPVKHIGTYRGGRKFEVEFLCQPYAYLLTGNNLITITAKDTKINNPEDISKPLIKIYGTGAVDLIVNSNIHKFNIDEYVTADSELMECYKDTTLTTFTGDFPEFASGENTISWDGTVTKIEVIPKWRR